MDTLIDKRDFPKEMQEQYHNHDKKSKPQVLLIVITIIALGIIAFLVYNLFFKKKVVNQKEFYTPEEQVDVINSFNKTNPIMTDEIRQEKIDDFFKK